MKTLSETWFADGFIDFELKKYTLLAYLQEERQQNLVYPEKTILVAEELTPAMSISSVVPS